MNSKTTLEFETTPAASLSRRTLAVDGGGLFLLGNDPVKSFLLFHDPSCGVGSLPGYPGLNDVAAACRHYPVLRFGREAIANHNIEILPAAPPSCLVTIR